MASNFPKPEQVRRAVAKRVAAAVADHRREGRLPAKNAKLTPTKKVASASAVAKKAVVRNTKHTARKAAAKKVAAK